MTLSIITINYNDVIGLERTIQSVQEQTAMNYEHILIDGGSSDGSKELMELHQDRFSYFISETDQGIYHAMNKGIEQATGDYLLFLNSGDIFFDFKSIEKLGPFLNRNIDILYADVLLKYVDEKEVVQTHPEQLAFSYFIHRTLCHQSTLIKKNLFDTYGLYNTNYRVIADWEFFIKRIFINQVSYEKIHHVMSIYDMNGFSAHPDNHDLIVKEREKVLSENFIGFMKDYEKSVQEGRLIQEINNKIGTSFLSLMSRSFFIKSQRILVKWFVAVYKLKDFTF